MTKMMSKLWDAWGSVVKPMVSKSNLFWMIRAGGGLNLQVQRVNHLLITRRLTWMGTWMTGMWFLELTNDSEWFYILSIVLLKGETLWTGSTGNCIPSPLSSGISFFLPLSWMKLLAVMSFSTAHVFLVVKIAVLSSVVLGLSGLS